MVHQRILRINFLKFTRSKINFLANKVKIGSKAYPSDINCIKRSNSTIVLPTADAYQPAGYFLTIEFAYW